MLCSDNFSIEKYFSQCPRGCYGNSLDEQLNIDNNKYTFSLIGPILALCLRGTFARSLWLDAVGPSDPALARRTDPNSLCALYGGESRSELFFIILCCIFAVFCQSSF